jgi:hypothetical protein
VVLGHHQQHGLLDARFLTRGTLVGPLDGSSSEMVHNFQNYFRAACHSGANELDSSMSDCAPGRVTKIAIGLADFCCYG